MQFCLILDLWGLGRRPENKSEKSCPTGVKFGEALEKFQDFKSNSGGLSLSSVKLKICELDPFN